MENYIIKLDNCRFFAFHGVLPVEKTTGNEFIVSVRVEYSVKSPEEDDLTNTISYADIYEIIKEEMAVPRNLLETVARQIGEKIHENKSGIKSIKVEIIKVSPPIPGFSGTASVEYQKFY